MAADRESQTTLLWQRADGSGVAERIPTPNAELHRFQFAPNAKFVIAAIGPAVKHDLLLIPLDPSMKPRQLTNIPFDEVAPSVSPDNQWVAYASNESGRYEVWISSIEHPETRIQVTTDGANAPVWRSDGKTLIVSTATHFIATALSFSPRVEVVKRDTLFASFYSAGANDRLYDFNGKAKRVPGVVRRDAAAESDRRRDQLVQGVEDATDANGEALR